MYPHEENYRKANYKFDGSIVKCVQNKMLQCTRFCALAKYWETQDIKSNVIFRIVVEKKFSQLDPQRLWEKPFTVNLNEMYKSFIKILNLKHKKFVQFKFSILHNILPSQSF